MSAVDDVDELIEQFHLEQGEFVKGTPEPCKKLFHGPSGTFSAVFAVVLRGAIAGPPDPHEPPTGGVSRSGTQGEPRHYLVYEHKRFGRLNPQP